MKLTLAEALDETIRKGLRMASDLFYKTDSEDRDADSYNALKSEIRKERAKLAAISTMADVQPFCDFLDRVVDKFNPGTPRFNRELKNIIEDSRRSFSKLNNRLHKPSPPPPPPQQQQQQPSGQLLSDVSPSLSEGETGIDEDHLKTESEQIQINESLYEALITSQIIDWFRNLSVLFTELKQSSDSEEVFISKKEFDQIFDEIFQRFQGSILDLLALILEYLPFKKVKDATPPAIEAAAANCFKAIVHHFQEQFKIFSGKLPIKFDPANGDQIVLFWVERFVKIDSFLSPVRNGDHLSKLEKENIDESTFFLEDILRDNTKASLGNFIFGRRYAYSQPKGGSSVFQASPDTTLYPHETTILKTAVSDHVREKKIKSDETVVRYFGSDTGKEWLLEWADYFNRTFHGGLEVRSEEELVSLAIEFSREAIIEASANHEPSETAPEIRDLKTTLPALDLREEERPEHISVDIFQRINATLRWARKAEKVGNRSIHKMVIAKTAVITLHLATLTEKQVLTYLIELEGLRELLGEDFKMTRRSVQIERWMEMIIQSTRHLEEEEPNSEDALFLEVKKYLGKLNTVITNLHLEITALGSVRDQDTSLEQEILGHDSTFESVQAAKEQTADKINTLKQALSQAEVGTQDFQNILLELTTLNARLVRLSGDLKDIEDRKKETMERKALLQGKMQELALKTQQLQLLTQKRAEKLAALRTALDDDIDNLISA